MLIITLSSSGILQALSTFPSNCKNKSAYFIKKRLVETISDQNVENEIIFGDLCAKPIDQLAVLTEEVRSESRINLLLLYHVENMDFPLGVRFLSHNKLGLKKRITYISKTKKNELKFLIMTIGNYCCKIQCVIFNCITYTIVFQYFK